MKLVYWNLTSTQTTKWGQQQVPSKLQYEIIIFIQLKETERLRR